MPDRVIYVADNQLVGTLGVGDMNEDGYCHFLKNDKKYFKDFFTQEAKKGIAFSEQLSKKADDDSSALTESLPTSDIFSTASVHPLVYFDLFMQKYGEKWISLDPFVFIKSLEVDFSLKEPIDAVALNKIMSLQVVNSSENSYTNFHAFEKIVRAFNDKTIDFERRESEDLGVFEFAFAIDVLQRCTPNLDIYSSFTPEITSYIADVLASKEVYLYEPVAAEETSFKATFEEIVNMKLETALFKYLTSVIDKKNVERSVLSNISTICAATNSAFFEILRGTAEESAIEKSSVNLPKHIKDIVRLQTKLQVALSTKLKEKEQEYIMQSQIYNVSGDGTNGKK